MSDTDSPQLELLKKQRRHYQIRLRNLNHDIEVAMPEDRSESWKQSIREKREEFERKLEQTEAELEELGYNPDSNDNEVR